MILYSCFEFKGHDDCSGNRTVTIHIEDETFKILDPNCFAYDTLRMTRMILEQTEEIMN